MNILYIGSAGALSLLPFKKLLAHEYPVTAVGVYKPVVLRKKVIALENESLALAANQCGIELIDLSLPQAQILQQCQRCAIDLILMSCYARRLPDYLIDYAEAGCFNMHPSLLPQYRGPEPLFWQMKEGAQLGVSWHHVVHEFDAGETVLQKKIFVDEGAGYLEINSQVAQAGAELMIEMLPYFCDKTMPKRNNTDIETATTGSYHHYPQAKDFVVDSSVSAQQLYNFMRATGIFGFSYRCDTGNYRFYLDSALDYDNNSSLEIAEVHENKVYIPCREGVLIAAYTGKMAL